MSDWMIVLAGYLLGSLPFALLVARRHAGIDPRLRGSGNVGAANVQRLAGTWPGVAVLVLDVAKGLGAVWLAQAAGGGEALRAACGLSAIVGHVYPVWLRFRGGKGVAVACGAFAALMPAVTAGAVALFTLVVWATRLVSLGSLVATVTLPVAAYASGRPLPAVAAASAAAALIVFRHRSNIARLRAGTERRLGERFDPLAQ